MQKPRKKIYIPDIYIGLLALPIIAIIAIISSMLVPWILDLINFFHR